MKLPNQKNKDKKCDIWYVQFRFQCLFTLIYDCGFLFHIENNVEQYKSDKKTTTWSNVVAKRVLNFTMACKYLEFHKFIAFCKVADDTWSRLSTSHPHEIENWWKISSEFELIEFTF